MKTLLINTHDQAGGAARAAFRLHQGLLRLGHASTLWVAHRVGDDPTVTAFQPPMDLPRRLGRLWRRWQIARELVPYRASRPPGSVFSSDHSEYGSHILKQLPAADVINLHWVAGLVDYRAFLARVPSQTPIVWTLHDMSAFTGGCHYDAGCGKFAGMCGACPQLGSRREADLSRRIWARKQAAYRLIPPERLHIVTPSRWLADQARRSTLLGRFPVTVIPNGVNTDELAPRDPGFARAVLGLPADARVVLFVAERPGSDPRKGFDLLAAALANLPERDRVVLVSLGRGRPQIAVDLPHLHLGHISGSDRLLSVIYSAADLFVIPSLQDNLPNTALEALACGTPVVGFDVGGIPDVVRPGLTGELVPAGDVGALRAAINDLLADPERRAALADRCRAVALEKYNLEIQARHYADLFAALCAGLSGEA